MNECCRTCANRFDLTKSDHTKKGTDEPIDTKMDGFICMAFAHEREAVWLVGLDVDQGFCEMYTPQTEEPSPQDYEKRLMTGLCHECAREGCEQCMNNVTKCSGYTPQTDCSTCKYDDAEWYINNCDECVCGNGKPSNYVPKQTDCPWK